MDSGSVARTVCVIVYLPEGRATKVSCRVVAHASYDRRAKINTNGYVYSQFTRISPRFPPFSSLSRIKQPAGNFAEVEAAGSRPGYRVSRCYPLSKPGRGSSGGEVKRC